MVVGTFVFAGLTTAFELVPPWLIKILIDDVIQAGKIQLLSLVFFGLCSAYLLRNICGSIRIKLNNSLEQQIVHDLHVQVFGALQRLSISFFENRSTGEIMSRVLNDTEHMQRIFVDGLEEIITAGLTLVGIMVVLFWLNWKLAFLRAPPDSDSDCWSCRLHQTNSWTLSQHSKGVRGAERPFTRCAGRHQRNDGV